MTEGLKVTLVLTEVEAEDLARALEIGQSCVGSERRARFRALRSRVQSARRHTHRGTSSAHAGWQGGRS